MPVNINSLFGEHAMKMGLVLVSVWLFVVSVGFAAVTALPANSLPIRSNIQTVQTSKEHSDSLGNGFYSMRSGAQLQKTWYATRSSVNASPRYTYTFESGVPGDADFTIWGGNKSTSCGSECTYYQSIVGGYGNPSGTLTVWLEGTNGMGGAGPRQNNISLSTATNFEYSADFYVWNGQLDARYGLVFNASSGAFPGTGSPPFDPAMNYYLLELRMDAATRTRVAQWQFLKVTNGARQALTTAADLPITISQNQWHNLKVTQQDSILSFYLNGSFVGSTIYDTSWGNNRRHFGLYIGTRAANGTNGPFEFFTDNIIVNDLTALSDLVIEGPQSGITNISYAYTATALPLTSTIPITYIWQATDQLPVFHSSDSVTDSTSFAWTTPGTKIITLTATNVIGTITGTHVINISALPLTGDIYESDNTCAQSRAISTNGTLQQHTFHQQADQDWITFNAISGTTYLIEAQIPGDSPADAMLELYNQCDGLPQANQDYTFSPGVRLQYTAQANTVVFLKLLNHTASVYGPQVAYDLSVRALDVAAGPGAVIIVAGKLRDGDPLQSNIHNIGSAVYNLFINHGYTADRVYYLATNLSLPGVDALATASNLQAAITTWAQDKVGPNQPFSLYLIDHGAYDRIYLDKIHNEWVTPQQINTWLTTLETAHPGVKVNVFVEACQSGSFIDPIQTVSGSGRVVLASTGPQNVAWASTTGALFSDYFISALDQGMSLYGAFQTARSAVQLAHPDQTPWLDDNADGTPNESTDGQQAQQRGFSYAGTLPDEKWPPYISQATGPTAISQSQGVIAATVLDDISVRRVWAVIYPPSYQPPTSSEELVTEALPTIVLLSQGNNSYAATYTGFNEIGVYRVAIYAEDDDHLQAQPFMLQIRTGWKVYLPLALKMN